jgi:hypothetical protein
LATIYQIAENYRQHGELEDAERRFEHILHCEPGNANARRGLDRTRAAMGKPDNNTDEPH